MLVHGQALGPVRIKRGERGRVLTFRREGLVGVMTDGAVCLVVQSKIARNVPNKEKELPKYSFLSNTDQQNNVSDLLKAIKNLFTLVRQLFLAPLPPQLVELSVVLSEVVL